MRLCLLPLLPLFAAREIQNRSSLKHAPDRNFLCKNENNFDLQVPYTTRTTQLVILTYRMYNSCSRRHSKTAWHARKSESGVCSNKHGCTSGNLKDEVAPLYNQ